MKRSNNHVWIGCGFFMASIIIAAVLFVGVKLASTSEEQEIEPDDAAVAIAEPIVTEEDSSVPANVQVEEGTAEPTSTWLVGSWRTPKLNEEGQILPCDVDSVVTFKPDGTYAGAGMTGSYSLDDNQLTYTELVLVDDAGEEDYSQFSESTTLSVQRESENVMQLDVVTLLRCT